MQRRKFIRLSSLGASMLVVNPAKWNPAPAQPIIVSTWADGKHVNEEAWKVLSGGGRALDAVEKGARWMEDQINCCVGLGANPDRDGIVTLDSCVMDEHANCGAVAALERIKHPVSVARKVMELTPHVLLVGQGAQQFALDNGFTLEPQKLSPSAEEAYKKWLEKSEYKPEINIENKKNSNPPPPMRLEDGSFNHDTMGIVALDASGNMSGGVTTSGMGFKMRGRVGDSPIIGAGLFVDNEVGAATSSGMGEEVIRICGTHLVVEFMRQGYTPETACRLAVERIVKRDPEKAKKLQVGFLALDKRGRYGAFAIQKGFEFAVRSGREEKVLGCKYVYDYGVT
ncbi:MAG: N(4)-(beta-N-acetylglucosaminyl)-L-asparaginase [Chitinophagaceae bacterium]|nr:N(4)-(beta-N-acetylglucosaminyl)-L-asparaginase [Chitinophagaceae bacterium]